MSTDDPVQAILDDAFIEVGWNPETQLQVLRDFIKETGMTDALANYVENLVESEILEGAENAE